MQPQSDGLQLFNSLTGRKEAFQPQESAAGQVLMYVCGVTVYDFSHVGHARVYTTFDLLYRLLLRVGYKVHYVRNFTDIDDKIINRAHQNKENIADLSNRFITEFHHDMSLLNCLEPTLEPRATDHVECMVATIERIIANKHAYAVDGNVWFDVASLPGYGRLSGRSSQEEASEQAGQLFEDGKRSAADFALWKSAKPGEPTWDSPWGKGRPGWHLECSSMIRHLMGPVIDIHGGGRDLVFPHHENEIAQSQAAADEEDRHVMAHGRDFVRFWVHNGFVNVDSEKMSKSLGNFFTIREVLKLYPALALRLFLLSTQYRQAVNYTQRALEEAADRLYYMYQTVHDAESLLDSTDEGRTALHESSGVGVQYCTLSTYYAPCHLIAFFSWLCLVGSISMRLSRAFDSMQARNIFMYHSAQSSAPLQPVTLSAFSPISRFWQFLVNFCQVCQFWPTLSPFPPLLSPQIYLL